MEFNIFLIYTVLLIIFSFLLLLGKIGEGNILSSLWNSVQQAVLPAGLVAGIIYSITTDVSIIYADGSHEEKNVLFSCDVRDQNGFPQKLSGLGFSNKYIYNGSRTC